MAHLVDMIDDHEVQRHALAFKLRLGDLARASSSAGGKARRIIDDERPGLSSSAALSSHRIERSSTSAPKDVLIMNGGERSGDQRRQEAKRGVISGAGISSEA